MDRNLPAMPIGSSLASSRRPLLPSLTAPYVTAAMLLLGYGALSSFPQWWWVWISLKCLGVAAVMRALRAEVWLRLSLVITATAGGLFFMTVTGGWGRMTVALIITFTVWMMVRGAGQRAAVMPLHSRASAAESLFLGTIGVAATATVAAAAHVLFRFPMSGSVGIVWLVTFVLARLNLQAVRGDSAASRRWTWAGATVCAEIAAVSLLTPFIPLLQGTSVAAGFVAFAALAGRAGQLNRREAVAIGAGYTAAVVILLLTTRWP